MKRNSPTLAFGLTALVACGSLVLPAQPAAAAKRTTRRAKTVRMQNVSAADRSSNVPAPYPNFDIRQARAGKLDLEKYAKAAPDLSLYDLTAAQKAAGTAVDERIEAAVARLSPTIPNLRIENNAFTGIPEIVDVAPGQSLWLTKRSKAPVETVAREFLTTNAGIYGLTPNEVRDFETTQSYTNPDGNLSFVELQQKIDGIPVFGGTLRAALTRNHEIGRTINETIPGVDHNAAALTGKQTAISAAQAVAAAADTIGVAVNPASLVVTSSTGDGTHYVFEPGPFSQPISVDLQYFPVAKGAPVLSWSVQLFSDDPCYWLQIDANQGTMLWRKNLTAEQSQTATYSVYTDDSPAPLSPTNVLPGSGTQAPGVARTNVTVVSENAADSLGWITDGNNTTSGNNVDAGLDLVAPDGVDAGTQAVGSPTRVFNFPYNPSPSGTDAPTDPNYRNGVVTNLFYLVNHYHDRVYDLGFTEAARNFQVNNFGRGGVGNDPVSAQAQDRSGTNNANFSTGPDGGTARCQMYVFTGPTPDRDGALDAEIVLHELTHGLSNRLHANAAGLAGIQSGGMGEGWSDFYARCILSDATEDVTANYASGAYATFQLGGLTDNYYYGIRRFPYALISSKGGPGNKPFNPLTLADIDYAKIDTTDGAYLESPLNFTVNNGAAEVHNVGEIWCSMLLEARAKLITRLGWATGNQRMLQIVTDGMKLDVANPSLAQARDSIIMADCMGFAGADETDIWAGFALRGNGPDAIDPTDDNQGAYPITEDFNPLPFKLGTVTITDNLCNGNGAADPGEPVVLSVPVVNNYKCTNVSGVTAAFNGGAAKSYGTINAGATGSVSFPYIVPSNAVCGSLLSIPIDVATPLGNKTLTYLLRVGSNTNYSLTGSTTGATIVHNGTPTLVAGSQFDEGLVSIPLPSGFAYEVYGIPVTSMIATTNGQLEFNETANYISYTPKCLPSGSLGLHPAIAPFWDDFNLGNNAARGIFTSTSGSAPNRILNVEWKGVLFGTTTAIDVELRLYEGLSKFDVIYVNATNARGRGSTAVIGVQQGPNGPFFQQSCNTANAVNAGTQFTFTRATPTCSAAVSNCGFTRCIRQGSTGNYFRCIIGPPAGSEAFQGYWEFHTVVGATDTLVASGFGNVLANLPNYQVLQQYGPGGNQLNANINTGAGITQIQLSWNGTFYTLLDFNVNDGGCP